MGNQYLLLDIGELWYAVPMEYMGYIVPSEREYRCCTPTQMPFLYKPHYERGKETRNSY